MSGWAKKRFWKDVALKEADGGWQVALDGRLVKTPAKAELILPTRALAEALAEEWRAVDELIDPEKMPVTRSANSAIDKVTVQFDDVTEMIAAYGGSDLLCYRADSPAELVARQASAWDPLLDWAQERFGARLSLGAGVMPVKQSEDALSKLGEAVRAQGPWGLTALHDLVGISGSLVLGLAVISKRLTAAEAWTLSRIDEDWQIEQWGEDEEAAERAAFKASEMAHAENFYVLSMTA